MNQSGSMVSKLNELGYRLTPQRAMVLSAIENSGNHISAEEIHAQIKTRYPQVNVSTVYRTLELLKQLGLVTETNLGEGRVRYHPAEKGRHHHLVCQKCGAIIDLDEMALTALKDVLLRQYKFLAALRHMALFGNCVNCNKE